MEIQFFLAICLFMVLLLTVVNTVWLVAIAASLAKVIKYIQGDVGPIDDWAQIIRNRRNVDPQNRPPNYAEMVSAPIVEDKSPHWDGLPKGRNWDGLPNPTE